MKKAGIVLFVVLGLALGVALLIVVPSPSRQAVEMERLRTEQEQARSVAEIARQETEQARAELDKVRAEYDGRSILEIVQAHNEIAVSDAEAIRRLALADYERRRTVTLFILGSLMAWSFAAVAVVFSSLDAIHQWIGAWVKSKTSGLEYYKRSR